VESVPCSTWLEDDELSARNDCGVEVRTSSFRTALIVLTANDQMAKGTGYCSSPARTSGTPRTRSTESCRREMANSSPSMFSDSGSKACIISGEASFLTIICRDELRSWRTQGGRSAIRGGVCRPESKTAVLGIALTTSARAIPRLMNSMFIVTNLIAIKATEPWQRSGSAQDQGAFASTFAE